MNSKKMIDTLNTENLDNALSLSQQSSNDKDDNGGGEFEMQTKSKFQLIDEGGEDDPSPLRPSNDLRSDFFIQPKNKIQSMAKAQ